MPSRRATSPSLSPSNRPLAPKRVSFPSARALGVTHSQHAAIRRVAILYGQIEKNLSYWNLSKSQALLEEAESIMMAHFPDDPQGWIEKVMRARGEGEVVEANRAFADNERAKRARLLINEPIEDDEPVATAAG